jgi:hypothetical protein
VERAAGAPLGVEHLEAHEFRLHDGHGCVDQRFVQRRAALLADELRAERLQQLGIAQVVGDGLSRACPLQSRQQPVRQLAAQGDLVRAPVARL